MAHCCANILLLKLNVFQPKAIKYCQKVLRQIEKFSFMELEDPEELEMFMKDHWSGLLRCPS